LLSDIDRCPVCALAGHVDHAFVWASTVTVDLVDGHGKLTTGGNLGESAAVLLKDGLSASDNLVVTTLCNP
jgi:hypothetical protein